MKIQAVVSHKGGTGESTLYTGETVLIESDASFLLQLDNIDAAERLLMRRIALLNNVDYIALTEWVDQLAQKVLLASLIYRELLNDLLKRGYSKANHYGVDYWFQLQQLSPKVLILEPFLTQQLYQQQEHQEHGRKHSFWKRVSEQGA